MLKVLFLAPLSIAANNETSYPIKSLHSLCEVLRTIRMEVNQVGKLVRIPQIVPILLLYNESIIIQPAVHIIIAPPVECTLLKKLFRMATQDFVQ